MAIHLACFIMYALITEVFGSDDVNYTVVNSTNIGFTATRESDGATVPTPLIVISPISPSLLVTITNAMGIFTRKGLSICSLVTNGISLIVFIRMAQQKQNVMILFIAISIVDTFSLADQFNSAIIILANSSGLFRFDAACRLFKWIQAASQDCSSYFTLAYTLERYISVRFPLMRATICTRSRILTAMVAIIILSLLAEIYIPVCFQGDNKSSCGPFDSNKRNVYITLNMYIHLIVGRYVPYIAIAVLNILIIFRMRRYIQQRAQMSTNAKTDADDKAQRSMTIMLTVVSTYSIVVTLPALVSYSIDPWRVNADPTIGYYNIWAVNIILPWNYCGNFFFYFISGKQFRRQIWSTVCCCRHKINSSNLTATSTSSASSMSASAASTIQMNTLK